MVFKWKNKDEELPMSIEREDDLRHPFQWGTLWFGVAMGMIMAVALMASLSMTFDPL